MEDMFRIEIEVGDEVMFASGARGDDSLYRGTIKEFNGSVILIKKDGGSINKRYKHQVMSLKPQMEFIPEFFI